MRDGFARTCNREIIPLGLSIPIPKSEVRNPQSIFAYKLPVFKFTADLFPV
jgi:hypothetical protein